MKAEALVKICGITNRDDALACSAAGVDLLGFNFYSRSPRFVSMDEARRIVAELPEGIESVGVFVNSAPEDVRATVERVRLDAVQLHGDESPDYCRALRRGLPASCTLIKAFRAGADFRIADIDEFPADAVLLDAYRADLYGGTGETCDWTMARAAREAVPRLFLAGGLTAENVAAAVQAVRPYAVDACSGVESAPGRKSLERLARFVAAVRGAVNLRGKESVR